MAAEAKSPKCKNCIVVAGIELDISLSSSGGTDPGLGIFGSQVCLLGRNAVCGRG